MNDNNKIRKVIAIGESVFDTVFEGNAPVRAFVGGRISNAVATLGQIGLPSYMVSECCADAVGDIVVDFFKSHNVDVKSIDRFTDGSTPFSAIFKGAKPGGEDATINYGSYPPDRFDVIWPRIDEDDVVLFGSLYAIDPPLRQRLFELVSYAAERKAIIIYLPGFQHGINFRITRVMPSILENLEIADLVIAHERDLNTIFPSEDCATAFRNHIEFYCPAYAHINANQSISLLTTGNRIDTAQPAGGPAANLLGWQAGFTAGIIYTLFKQRITREGIRSLDEEAWRAMLAAATAVASDCAQAGNTISPGLARQLAQELAQSQPIE